MPTAEINGLRVNYERAGAGPALVLLHGIGSNARSWRYQLADLADAYTVVAWDGPGFGRSDDPAREMPMSDYADYLEGLLDALGIDQAHIAGLSWGGVLAQEFYRSHAARVLSLCLADTFAGGRSRPEAERQRNLEMRMRMAAMDPVEMARERTPALLSPHASPELLAEVASISAERHAEGYRLAALASSNADTRDVHSTIRVPTLVVWGEYDTVGSRRQAEGLRDAIPGARLVVIPGAGHVSNQEQPALFNAAVREFLAAVPSAGPLAAGTPIG